MPDAEAPIDARSDATTDAPSCSPSGWCPTTLPDTNLTLRDISVLPGRAFAVAESPNLGVKVLEWAESAASWSYIDDNTQNESGRGAYVGKIWSPNENEIYFTVAPHTVYHGKRNLGAPPQQKSWTWTSQQLESRIPAYDSPGMDYFPNHYFGRPKSSATNSEFTALGVFGTSAGDVYAWYGNAIYHLASDAAGNAAWVVEYVADDLDRDDEQLFFLGATATGQNELWFVGGRGGSVWDSRNCAIVVTKRLGEYRRIADATAQMGGGFPPLPAKCEARAGTILVDSATGWLTDVLATSGSTVVALNGGRNIARISSNGGAYSVEASPIPRVRAWDESAYLSMWTAPGQPLWLGGLKLVVQNKDVWGAGEYEISSISLNGGWLNAAIYQIRGSSDLDLWAVGAGYALHKTTP
ncbi:hypothetical protein AKJ09_08003 [Labilithrix luteola]|uniref:Type IV fimbrial biogenesis protein PilY1 n=1 Tax=Labilithrix luteola TaxID=1391654 RepID=A0A0K1Q7G6_9BACT|nr:hypothetical protein AKJ09_08003 [Labilithrix luteola]